MTASEQQFNHVSRIAQQAFRPTQRFIKSLPKDVQTEALCEARCEVFCRMFVNPVAEESFLVQIAAQAIERYVQREYRHFHREGEATLITPDREQEDKVNDYSIDESADKRDMQMDVQMALDMLPERVRKVALLRGCYELPYAEIARVLRVSISTVEKRWQQAKQLLRYSLQDYRQEFSCKRSTCYFIVSDPDRASTGYCPQRTFCAERTIEDIETRCTYFGGEGRPLHPGLPPCQSSNPQHGYCSMNLWAHEQAVLLGRECESESYYLRERGCQCSIEYRISP